MTIGNFNAPPPRFGMQWWENSQNNEEAKKVEVEVVHDEPEEPSSSLTGTSPGDIARAAAQKLRAELDAKETPDWVTAQENRVENEFRKQLGLTPTNKSEEGDPPPPPLSKNWWKY